MSDKKIVSRVVFEMIGRPKEHLKKTMEDFLKTLETEKGVRVISKTVHEPKKLKKEVMEKNKYNGEMFSTFAELEIESEHVMNLFNISFKYLPSHMEVISPESFLVDNLDLNAVTNEIINRIHHYDSLAKAMLMQNKILSKRVEELIAENRNKGAPAITFNNSDLIKKPNKTGKNKR